MYLSRIIVYPIKSLDGVQVTQSIITPGGILQSDRAFAIFDQDGKYVNGKRHARIHQVRSTFSADLNEVSLVEEGSSVAESFVLAEREPLNRWLSSFLGFAVKVEYEPQNGYPDDREAFGPTVVGEASLQEIVNWYPDLTVESVRRRFRTNLEVSGPDASAFCEDRLYRTKETLHPFNIGSVRFHGHNPCQRCAVPTRDPNNGEILSGFQKEFMKKRREKLPAWAEVSRFNHYYRFAVNTSVPPSEAGKAVRVGDLIWPELLQELNGVHHPD